MASTSALGLAGPELVAGRARVQQGRIEPLGHPGSACPPAFQHTSVASTPDPWHPGLSPPLEAGPSAGLASAPSLLGGFGPWPPWTGRGCDC